MPREGRGGGREDGGGGGRGRGQSRGLHTGIALGGRQYQGRGLQNETGPKAGTPECRKYKPRY